MYAWYEEDLASFLLSHNLPAYNIDDDIKVFYEAYKSKFLSDFSAMIKRESNRSFDNNFYSEIEKCYPNIESMFDSIIKILYAYDTSNMKLVQEYFDGLMDELWENLFITSIAGVDRWLNGLYRIREASESALNPNDLFHIPYNKRHLITNERYSLSGHPCLYLATFLGIAWQECGYPPKFYYSEFKINDDFKEIVDWKFIHFISPRKNANDFCVLSTRIIIHTGLIQFADT